MLSDSNLLLAVLLTALLLTPALSGCGSTDDSDSDASADTTAADATDDLSTGDTQPEVGTPDVSSDAVDVHNDSTADLVGDAKTLDVTGGATFAEVFDVVVGPSCAIGYCHGGGAGGLQLMMVGPSFDALVGVDAAAPKCGATKLVEPGNPEMSVLWHRLNPSADPMDPCGPKMPLMAEALDEEKLQLIYNWISAGAPRE